MCHQRTGWFGPAGMAAAMASWMVGMHQTWMGVCRLPGDLHSSIMGSCVHHSLGAGGGAWLFTHPLALAKLERGLERLPAHRLLKGPIRLLREGLYGMARLRSLLRPGPLLLGTSLASLAWLLEATLLHGLFNAMGSPIGLEAAAVVRTATALGGVLSVLPAGLGTSELTSIGLAVAFGASRPVALATTLILRLVTVVLPSLVGSLILMRHRPHGRTIEKARL